VYDNDYHIWEIIEYVIEKIPFDYSTENSKILKFECRKLILSTEEILFLL